MGSRKKIINLLVFATQNANRRRPYRHCELACDASAGRQTRRHGRKGLRPCVLTLGTKGLLDTSLGKDCGLAAKGQGDASRRVLKRSRGR